jgi:hypothetical protein
VSLVVFINFSCCPVLGLVITLPGYAIAIILLQDAVI